MEQALEPNPKANAFKTILNTIYFHKLPSYGNKIFYGLGFLALTSLIMLVVTGSILAFMGQPWWLYTKIGIFTRSVHLWSVQALIAILLLHMTVGFFTSGFKAPRRMVWVFGAAIFCLVLIQTEFGYGLRGDFSSQFRATSGADFWNGAYLGWWINPLSHLQEYAIHIAIIPLAIFTLFILHYVLEHTYGIAKPYRKDIKYTMAAADHKIMYIRGIILILAIIMLAYVFPSPYVPELHIAEVASKDPQALQDALTGEYEHTSDTATYVDSIQPYTFDTRTVFITEPYQQISGSNAPASEEVMISAIIPAIKSGLYESILNQEDPAPHTYTLRFLSDMGALEDQAGKLGFSTEQWGMAKDEDGHLFSPTPGSWWLLPIAFVNTAFDLLDNDNGDRIAAEIMGAFILLIITFPYLPWINRIPELFPVAPFIWKEETKTKPRNGKK